MKLNSRKWKPFKIEDLFDIGGTKTTKLQNLISSEEELIKYPYITTKSRNNGVDGFYKLKTEKGRVIVFESAINGYLSYQKNDFSASDHVEVMRPKEFELNEYIAHFIITSINKSIRDKFSYGFKLSQSRMKKQTLLLPVKSNNDEKPDWGFIEEYMKYKYSEKENLYKEYFCNMVNKLEYKNLCSLKEKLWADFLLIDIFPDIQRGKRLTKKNQIEGTIPYISSSSINNGVDNYISNDKNVRKFCNCLTIANSGSVGVSFYQPFEFIASDHVTHLKNENMNKYIYLFIATILNRLSEKYNFNREINDKRILREKIMLPVDELGNPDYKYMEQYIKNLMLSKYEQYSFRYNELAVAEV